MSLTSTAEQLSDEELRKWLKPNVTEEDALKVLDASYVPSSGSQHRRILKQLDSYDDANFWVEINNVQYLLKFHNGVESQDYLRSLEGAAGDYHRHGHQSSVIHWQTTLMEILNQEGIRASIPRPPLSESYIDTDDHEDETSFQTGVGKWPDKNLVPVCVHELPVVSSERSPCNLVVRLLTWTSGRPLSALRAFPVETLAEAGRLLGRINRAFDKLTLVDSATKTVSDAFHRYDTSVLIPGKRYHQWDGKHTADLESFVQHIPDQKRRSLVESVLDAFQRDILDTGIDKKFRTGALHGDFNDANILVDEDLNATGVIDFGDSIISWRVLDISVAMAYATLSVYGKSKRMISAAAAILRGYNAVYPLTELERKHLVLLMCCRLACSVTLGAFSFQQNPENKYLLLHSEPAWEALELLWCYDPGRRFEISNAANSLFSQACLYKDSLQGVVDCSDIDLPDPTVPDYFSSVRALPMPTGHRQASKDDVND